MINDQLSLELLATGYEALMAMQSFLPGGAAIVMLTMAQMPEDARAIIEARQAARR